MKQMMHHQIFKETALFSEILPVWHMCFFVSFLENFVLIKFCISITLHWKFLEEKDYPQSCMLNILDVQTCWKYALFLISEIKEVYSNEVWINAGGERTKIPIAAFVIEVMIEKLTLKFTL